MPLDLRDFHSSELASVLIGDISLVEHISFLAAQGAITQSHRIAREEAVNRDVLLHFVESLTGYWSSYWGWGVGGG